MTTHALNKTVDETIDILDDLSAAAPVTELSDADIQALSGLASHLQSLDQHIFDNVLSRLGQFRGNSLDDADRLKALNTTDSALNAPLPEERHLDIMDIHQMAEAALDIIDEASYSNKQVLTCDFGAATASLSKETNGHYHVIFTPLFNADLCQTSSSAWTVCSKLVTFDSRQLSKDSNCPYLVFGFVNGDVRSTSYIRRDHDGIRALEGTHHIRLLSACKTRYERQNQ